MKRPWQLRCSSNVASVVVVVVVGGGQCYGCSGNVEFLLVFERLNGSPDDGMVDLELWLMFNQLAACGGSRG